MYFPGKPMFLAICVLLYFFLCWHIFDIYNSYNAIPVRDHNEYNAETSLREALTEEKGAGCDLPYIDNSLKLERPKHTNPMKCNRKAWVTCYMSICRLRREIIKSLRKIECRYSDLIINDEKVPVFEDQSVLEDDEVYQLNRSDHVRIICTGKSRRQPRFRHTSIGYGSGFRKRLDRVQTPNEAENSYQVLIFGFANAYKNLFIRKMPLTYEFLTKLGATTVLNGYSILREGATAALLPILSGKSEYQLNKETRKYWKKEEKFLDEKEFIFHKLNLLGYRTAYFDDRLWHNISNSRLKGFINPPSDHYLGDIFEAKYDDEYMDNRRPYYCFGDTMRFQHMIQLTEQFFRLDGKHFSFTFISDTSQEQFYLMRDADKPFAKFLKRLNKAGVFQDTLLIVMGEHGPKLSSDTLPKERLPFMAIRLPDRLRTSRPDAQTALSGNTDVLTTPHDIHATILDVLGLQAAGNPYRVRGADLPRALSLLEPVPRTRSCSEAGIEAHWCACSSWEVVPHVLPIYGRVVRVVVDHINNLTLSLRDICPEWTIESVISVKKRKVEKGGFTVQKSQNNATAPSEVYQAKFVLNPGRAYFEATVIYLARKNEFLINPYEVIRIDVNEIHAECIINRQYPHLSKYCHCDPYKKLPTTTEPESELIT